MRTVVVTACMIVVGFLSFGQGMALVPSTAIPEPGAEVALQVAGAPVGAQFRWDLNGDGRPDETTNNPWVSWIVPAGPWGVGVEVVQAGRVVARLSAAGAVDARLGVFRSVRSSGGAVEVTVTVQAKQFLVAPALAETLPAGWVVAVLDGGGAIWQQGAAVLEVLWPTSLDPGKAVRIVYALHPPAPGATARVSGIVSAYQSGRRVEVRIVGTVTF